MADTIITPDGKLHALVGSTTLESVVLEYAGADAADQVCSLIRRNAYEEARAETDLGAFEESLSHWRSMAQEWLRELEFSTEREPITEQSLLRCLRRIRNEIKQEI